MLTRSPVVPAVGVAVAALLSAGSSKPSSTNGQGTYAGSLSTTCKVAELHGEQKLPKPLPWPAKLQLPEVVRYIYIYITTRL